MARSGPAAADTVACAGVAFVADLHRYSGIIMVIAFVQDVAAFLRHDRYGGRDRGGQYEGKASANRRPFPRGSSPEKVAGPVTRPLAIDSARATGVAAGGKVCARTTLHPWVCLGAPTRRAA